MASDIVVCPGMGPSAWDFQKVAADLSIKCCMVPLWGPSVKLSYASHKAVTDYKKAKALGVDTVPVLVGPVSYLLLSKPAKGVEESFSLLSLLGKILPIYKEVITELKEAGASWIQFDEPTLVMDLESHKLHAFIVGKDKLVVSTSCSLLHTTVDLVNETKLDKEIKSWLAFAAQKVVEVNALAKALAGQKDEEIFSANAAAQASRKSSPRVTNEAVQKAAAALKGSDHRPMKGMLTGPVTILNWSFVRNDQPRFETCYQIALAIKDEVEDLEKNGITVIQIDEAALREGLPLRKSEQAFYLDWAVHSFRITNCGVLDTTQIHTHMCYSNFNDIIHSIIDMDADVITIENSRSDEKLLSVFREGVKYGAGIGPGVYDIHSPRIPSTEEIADRINKMLAVLETNILWVNPDCGLKTRKYTEVKPALKNMVDAAKFLKPMRVKIMVNSHEYIALIDTGSTYNVLHPRVAREVGLKIINDDPIKVSTADGSIMCSEGSCPEFKFVIQGRQFATPAYILQLGGFDVILGIQWLRGLGQINWDFASLKMELTQGDRTIQIKGMDTEESEEGCSTDEKLVSMVREGVKYGAGIVYDIHSPRVPSTEEIADGINKMLAVLETIQVNPDCGQPRRLSMIPAC